MHRAEEDRLATCAGCGRETPAELGRSFASGPGLQLCWECAVARGGSYDETLDRWTTEPRVDDLSPSD